VQNPNNPLKHLAALSGLALQMLAILGVLMFVGLKLNEFYLEQGNYFTLAFSLLGVVLSIAHVIRRVIKTSKK
jgi:hypothetical protein